MKHINSNRIIGLLMGLLALGYLWMAFHIPSFPMPRPVDSDGFPKLLGFALLLLSVMLFLEKEKVAPSEEKETAAPKEKQPGLSPRNQLLVTCIAIAGYALSLEPLGFVLASSLLGFGLSYGYGYRRHRVNLAATLCVVLSLYLIMTRLLEVHLPQGLLPF